MKKILTIGDVHGRSLWKNFGDIPMLLKDKTEPKYDLYIFLGDYADSFDQSNIQIKQNLLDIIDFKQKYPDNVILLWGNHEMHYLYMGKYRCSGFRPEAQWDLYDIFSKNRKLFQLAYQYENYLFTHAGVHKGWFKYRFKNIDHDGNIADNLNIAFEVNSQEIFDVGYRRGGSHTVGGPLWVDKDLMSKKPLDGYHQIVGHTHMKEIKTYVINENTSVTFCDNQIDFLSQDDDIKNYYYTLEIK